MREDIKQFQERIKELQIQISELKAITEKYNKIIETAFNGFWILDSQGIFLEVNDSYCEMIGYTRSELLKMSISDIEAIESKKDITERIIKTIKSSYDRFESKHKCKNGKIIDVEVSASYLPEYNGGQFAVFIQEITEYNKQKLLLAESENEIKNIVTDLKKAQKVSKLGSWEWYIKDNRLKWSDEMYRIFGIDKDRFSGKLSEVIEQSIHPDDREKVEASNNSVITKSNPIPLEYRIVLPDKTIKTVWAEAGEIIFDDDSKPLILSGIVQDISAKKKDEDELLAAKEKAEESEKKYRTMYENSPAGIFRSTYNGNIVSANPTFLTIYGFKNLDELTKTTAQDYYTDSGDRKRILSILKKEGLVKNHITKEFKKDKTEIWVKCDYSAVKNEKGEILFIDGVLEDITEKVIADKALKESEEKFKGFFNSNPSAIFVWEKTDDDFTLIEINDTAQRNTNNKAKKFIGLKSSEIYADLPYMKEKLNMCYTTKSIIEFEDHYLNRYNNTYDWVSFRMAFSEPKTIILFADLITDRKETENQLQRSEMKFRALFEQAGGYCMILDPNTNDGIPIILDANKAAYEKHGYSYEEFIGRPVSDIDDEEGKKLVKERTALIMTGKPFYTENVHIRKDGSTFTVAVNAKRIDIEGEPPLIFTTEYDITELKRTEKELTKAKEKAEESDRLKTEFLNNMSHEIRTPLNGILGFSTLLCQDSISKEKKNSFTNIIQDSGQRLARVIEDIVDISMIESNQLEILKSKINVSDLLNNLFIKYQNLKLLLLKPELSLKLNCQIDKTLIIDTDKIRLSQVIDNLITNAIKYSDEGLIEIGCEITKINQLLIYVKDNGSGIPEDQTHKLFKRFSHIETGKLREGTGIGLAISKGIILLLGGDIWYEQNTPNGAIFKFTLPLSSKQKAIVSKSNKKNKEQINTKSHNRKLIYVAEDDITSTQYLMELFSETQFDVKYSSNGLELLDLIKKKTPDLILLDIKMPQMDGFEALTKIKKNHPNLPIIAQTAHAMNNEKMRIKEAGFDDYISKPINEEEFHTLINKYFENN